MEVCIENAIANAMTHACEFQIQDWIQVLTNISDTVKDLDYKDFAVKGDKNETAGHAPANPPGPIKVPASSIPAERARLQPPITIEDNFTVPLCLVFKDLFLKEITASLSPHQQMNF